MAYEQQGYTMIAVQKKSDTLAATFRFILIAMPVVSLIISAWSWLRFGVDIPVYDDWRQYNANDMGRLDLKYLFTPHNDTLYTFGLLLDSVAFRLLDGNTIAYQLISMISVLGGILLLQWKLLKKFATDKNSLAVAFSFTLLMLQPDTYWGWQNLAYHQAIPLACILATLLLATSNSVGTRTAAIVATCLGFVSGLSYISGAFSILSICATFILYSILSYSSRRKHFLAIGLALAVPAILTTAAQLWVIVEVQHGTHRADAPMAYPWEADFWLFMLGKVGRSLMLPMGHAGFSFTASIIAVSVLTLVFIKSLSKISSKNSNQDTTPFLVFISLCTVIFVYLLLISAGRTNLRPDTVNAPLEIFTYGFYRFHFFWITLLWPWLAYLVINWLKHQRKPGLLTRTVLASVTCLWIVLFLYTPIIDNFSFYKATMKQRIEGVSCITDKIQKPGPVLCPNIDLGDIAQGIKNGRNADASFARNLHILPIQLGSNTPRPEYRLSENLNTLEIVNATKAAENLQPLHLITGNDVNLLFKTTQNLASCEMLNISVSMAASADSVAQVFYLSPGDAGYNEQHSATANVIHSDEPQTINFVISNPSGFEQQIRFDPVTGPQDLKIFDLEVRCRSLASSK